MQGRLTQQEEMQIIWEKRLEVQDWEAGGAWELCDGTIWDAVTKRTHKCYCDNTHMYTYI